MAKGCLCSVIKGSAFDLQSIKNFARCRMCSESFRAFYDTQNERIVTEQFKKLRNCMFIDDTITKIKFTNFFGQTLVFLLKMFSRSIITVWITIILAYLPEIQAAILILGTAMVFWNYHRSAWIVFSGLMTSFPKKENWFASFETTHHQCMKWIQFHTCDVAVNIVFTLILDDL